MCMMVWPGWGTTIHIGEEVTQEHYALEEKYHLPLPPPPQINFVCAEIQVLVQICVSSKPCDFFVSSKPSKNLVKTKRIYEVLPDFTRFY